MAKSNSKKISGASLRHAFEEIIWPRKKLLGLGLVLIMIRSLSGLVLPASTQYLFDDVIANGDMDLFVTLLTVVGIAVALQAATSYALVLLLSVEAQHLIASLRTQVQQHVLHLPVRIFDNTKTGELVTRIMDDVEGVRNLVGTGLVQLVGGTVTAIVAFAYLVRIDVTMTALALVPVAGFAFVSTKAFATLRPAFRERGRIRAEVVGRLTEALGGIRVIKGFHALEKESEIFHAGACYTTQSTKSAEQLLAPFRTQAGDLFQRRALALLAALATMAEYRKPMRFVADFLDQVQTRAVGPDLQRLQL